MKPSTVLASLAVALSALQLALTTGRVAVAGTAGVVVAASLLHRRRPHAGSAVEVLLAMLLGGAGTVLHALAPEANGLGSAPLRSATFVFAFTGLGMAALRLHFERPEGGLAGSLAAAGLVFLACGSVRTGTWTPVLLALYLGLSFAALAFDAHERGTAPPPWTLRGRALVVGAVLVVMVPGFMWGWGRAGPSLVRASTSAVLDLFGPLHRTGFHDGPISLHALDGLSDSDTVVLRIEGPVAGPLRGNVYRSYDNGRWLPVERDERIGEEPLRLVASPKEAGRSTTIRYASGDTRHFFLPLGARPHHVEPEDAMVDAWQLVRADESHPETASFAATRAVGLAPAAPTQLDLEVPDALREALVASADALAGSAAMRPAARARALESALAAGFTYSTSFRESWVDARRKRPRVDPVLLFLEDLHTGHCEYFASGLALMLRAEGIPARLVSGYRVAERNPIGGWAVVRERDAHAWVEAYLPEVGWTTLDGTPLAADTAAAGLASIPRLEAIFDWLARQAHVHGRTVLLVSLVVGLASVQVVRLVRGRTPKGADADRRRARTSKALQALLGRLAEAGYPLDVGETLEGLARRLRSPDASAAAGGVTPVEARWPEPAFFEAADLLDRYAALRYGDIGDAGRIESALAHWPAPPDETCAPSAGA